MNWFSSFSIIKFVATSIVLSIFIPSVQSAQNSNLLVQELVHAPKLQAPGRGSVAGDPTSAVLNQSQLSKGSFSVSLNLEFPQARGPLLHPIQPTYTPSTGLSEWGMGFYTNLTIRRWREDRDIDFVDDDLLSPWGILKKGTDGYWYPKGLQTRTRVLWESADKIIAYLPNGVRLIFGNTVTLAGPKGIYAWYLTEVSDPIGNRNLFEYDYSPNENSYPKLKTVSYGGINRFPLYQVQFAYEAVPHPIFDYRAGRRLYLNSRVSQVSVFSKDLESDRFWKSGQFREVYRYDFSYSSDTDSPRYFLKQVQRTFAKSGKQEPALILNYESGLSVSKQSEWKHLSQYDEVVKKYGIYFYSPPYGSVLDRHQQGITEIENLKTFDIVTYDADIDSSLNYIAPKNVFRHCKPSPLNDYARPRNFVRFFGANKDLSVFWSYYDSDKNTTEIALCDILGVKTHELTLRSNWQLSSRIRLVDLNHDGKPDLIRLQDGRYLEIAENVSTPERGIQFNMKNVIHLGHYDRPKAIWFVDINGDGIADLVVRHRNNSFSVLYGTGNFEFDLNSREQLRFWAPGLGAGDERFGDNTEFIFGDFNNDGLTDVVVASLYSAEFYYNQSHISGDPKTGDKKGWVGFTLDLPGIPNDSFPPKPQILDLSGSGNPQIVVNSSRHIYSTELSHAGTGLLKSFNDGKGTSYHFEYAKADPYPGLGTRPTVVRSIEVKATGLAPVKHVYTYVEPKTRSISGDLLGFSGVEAGLQSGQATNIREDSFVFLIDDSTPPLVQNFYSQDSRTPQITGVEEIGYRNSTFYGIPFYSRDYEKTGFQGDSGDSLTTRVYEYDSLFCPRTIEESNSHGELRRAEIRSRPKNLENSLHCLPEDIKLEGTHTDKGLDFMHQLSIQRNTAGQPLKLFNGGSSGTSFLLQEMTYDDEGNIKSIYSPKEGRSDFIWNSSLLSKIEQTSGRVVEASVRDPLTDDVLSLSTQLGFDRPFSEYYRYDDWHRVISQWDSVNLGDVDSPLIKYSYKFATDQLLGRILTENRVDNQSNSSWNNQFEFFSSQGDSLGKASQNASSGSTGWHLSQVKNIDQTLRSSEAYQDRIADLNTLENLTSSLLLNDAKPVQFGSNSHAGFPIHNETTIQTNIKNSNEFNIILRDQKLIETRKENDWYNQTRTYSPDRKLLEFVNEAHVATQYSYDALGRLRQIRLPNGDLHKIDYDSHSQVSHISRSGIGDITHEYDSKTGLLVKKTYYGGSQDKVFEIGLKYDSAGRITQKTQTTFTEKKSSWLKSNSKAESKADYFYFYDGRTSSSSRDREIPGQLGNLTAIQGPEFSKVFKYDKSAKLSETELQLKNFKTLRTFLHYRSDGFLDEKTLQISQPDGRIHSQIKYVYITDSLGRHYATSINGNRALEIEYDDFSRIRSVLFPNKGVFEFLYDSVTQRLAGFRRQNLFETTWNLNARGFLDSETYDWVGEKSRKRLRRNYEYVDAGYLDQYFDDNLLNEKDRSPGSKYRYDALGIVDRFWNNLRESRFEYSDGLLSITAFPEAPRSYRLDALGRINFVDEKRFLYGPSGRVEQITTGNKTLAEYGYDENGIRLLKKKNGKISEIYTDEGLWTGDSYYEPIKINGIVLGVLAGDQIQLIDSDLRGTVLQDQANNINVPSPYGERVKNHPEYSSLIDYVARGYDPDLGAYRMQHRDYDPILKRFLTPDPLFLEEPERCIDRPNECNLYSYAGGNPATFVDPSGKSAALVFTSAPTNPAGIAVAIVTGLYSAYQVYTAWQDSNQQVVDPYKAPPGQDNFNKYNDYLTKKGDYSQGAGWMDLGSITGYKFKDGLDLDLRRTGTPFGDALAEAFRRTGVEKDQFVPTVWGKDANGKSFPVEWRAKNGAEVNIDIGHTKFGPDVPHIGYQTGGNRGTGGAIRGHILVDSVPVNR